MRKLRNAVFFIACVLTISSVSGGTGDELGVVKALFMQGNFDEIEKIADARRNQPITVHDYYSDLAAFYDALPHPQPEESDEIWDGYRRMYEKWTTAKASSVTAAIALARFNVSWVSLAQHARAGEENGRALKERLMAAEQLLERAQMSEPKDPEFFRTMLEVGTQTGWPREKELALFRRGIAAHPYYYPLYEAEAKYFAPTSYGERGEAERLAEEAAVHFKDEEGWAVYAIMAQAVGMMMGPDFFNETDFSFGRMQSGALCILQNANNLEAKVKEFNKLGYFAVIARNYELAKPLLDQLAKDPELVDLSFWGSMENFDAARAKIKVQQK